MSFHRGYDCADERDCAAEVGFEDMSGAGAPAVVDASVTSKLMPTSGASDRSSLAVKTSNLVG